MCYKNIKLPKVISKITIRGEDICLTLVEHFYCIHQALGSIPSMEGRKERRNKGRRKRGREGGRKTERKEERRKRRREARRP